MRLETFFENFELLADAPNGVQKLCELILQLAVRGKLVPQDPNDEPASVLLEKIQAEKEWLIKEKKIRSSKPLPSIQLNEIPFELSKQWEWTRLGEIGDWGAGATPERNNSEYYGGSITWFKSGELNNDYIRESEEKITELALNKCSLRLNRPGDVLIAMYGATIGKVAILEASATTNQAVCACTCFQWFYNRYLFLLLKAYKNCFLNQGAGGAQPNISREKIIHTVVPLPPFGEQKRIVAKVDQLMALCDELETRQQKRREGCVRLNNAAIDQLLTTRKPDDFSKYWQPIYDNFDLLYSGPENIGKLRQAILHLAVQGKLVPQDPNDEPASVLLEKIKAEKERLIKEKKINKSKPLPPIKPDEEPYALPSGWAWVRIDDFYEVVGGIQKTPKRKPVSHYFPYLRVANVYRGKLDLSEITYFELFEDELERWKLKAGDLLIVEGNGSEKEIGRCAVWNEEIKNCVHQNHLIRTRPIGHKGELFTLLFLNSPDGMAEMKRLAITTSGLYSLSVGKIRGIVVPLPPLREQQRILRKVEQLMFLCDELEAKLIQSQTDSGKLMDASVRQVLTT